jgi:CheY-like chemotaxis protein
MTSEIMNSAVDPFFTTKGMATNSGPGLSMVHGFVAQSGGAISFASEPGEGTIVTLYFSASRKERIAAEPKGGKLILVVEDDLPVRITVVNMLTELGYRTIEAANGAEALALIDENPDIDLVFTDMVLPAGLSGAEIASEARKRLPDIRILFTSGYSENYLDTSGSNQEADQILRKPYRKRDMANIVKSALD